jgi:hypothetical protein
VRSRAVLALALPAACLGGVELVITHVPLLIRYPLAIAAGSQDHQLLSLTGIRTAKGKWIRASDGCHQAFDMLADPRERQNFYSVGTDIPSPWKDMASRLEVRLPPVADPSPGGALDDITPATRERLRSLVYLD